MEIGRAGLNKKSSEIRAPLGVLSVNLSNRLRSVIERCECCPAVAEQRQVTAGDLLRRGDRSAAGASRGADPATDRVVTVAPSRGRYPLLVTRPADQAGTIFRRRDRRTSLPGFAPDLATEPAVTYCHRPGCRRCWRRRWGAGSRLGCPGAPRCGIGHE